MVFFAISGFLICESFLKTGDTVKFFVKRIRRIYPGYMVATSIGAFVVIPLFSTLYNFTPNEIAKTIGLNLLLRGYAPPSHISNMGYSVFYFAFSNSLKLRNFASYGDFSYGTYLYAYPIQQMIFSIFPAVSFPTFVFTSMVFSLAAGIASWLTIERWFLPRSRVNQRSG